METRHEEVLMRRVASLLLSMTLLVACASTRVGGDRTERSLPEAMPNSQQRAHVLRTVAGFKHLGFQVVAARLKLGVDTALAWRQLDTLLAKPTGDMFWMYPATGLYLNLRSQLDAAWRARFRSAWKTYTPYRGDTENHFLMYYASLLLMTQEWPGLPGSEWFNGKSSQENYDEARDFLEHWIDETVRHGSTEWDSPRYAYYYITPLVLLRDFTVDARLRKRCEMLLELTLADYAAEYLNGSYCGAHSRDSDGAVIDPRKAEVTSYAQLYFTDTVAFVLPDLAYAAMSDWQCASIIRAIAHDRDSSYVHTERKRSRAKIRYSAERYSTVYKYDYMTPDYCLGSIQRGVHQPIQQHTWDVTFASPKPSNTLFSLHPTWSAEELGTFFPEDPELMVESVARAKASYTNENKWVGGSKYEAVAQDRNTLVATYHFDTGDTVQHFDLFVPTNADTIVRDSSGWWFVRFGDAFVAVSAGFAGVRVDGGARDSVIGVRRRVNAGAIRMRSTLTYGYVVVTCARAADLAFGTFIEKVRSGNPSYLPSSRGEPLEVAIVDGYGAPHRFRIGWNSVTAIDSPRDTTAAFDGLHLSGRGDVVELRVHGHRRVLDFAAGEVRVE
jgi:hypothetical protein